VLHHRVDRVLPAELRHAREQLDPHRLLHGIHRPGHLGLKWWRFTAELRREVDSTHWIRPKRRKTSMTYRVKNIGIAVILAAFAGLLTIFYVANYKRHVQHGEKSVSVLVAARDIPAGTTGSEVVEQHYLSTETVPRRTVVPGAISSSDQLHNLVATDITYRGEQVSASRFG